MYKLPTDIDLSFLVGKELIQVCIGKHDAILEFHPDASVSLQTELTVRPVSGAATRFDEIPRAAPALVGLLNSVVERAYTPDSSTLIVEFSSGTVVEIHDTSEQFESYQISYGGRRIVV